VSPSPDDTTLAEVEEGQGPGVIQIGMGPCTPTESPGIPPRKAKASLHGGRRKRIIVY